MTIYPFQIGIAASRRKLQLKRAIIQSFAKPKDELAAELRCFSERDWKRVMWWLDVSGMTLYFLAQIRGSIAALAVPEPILISLNDRLQRNELRMESLLDETLSVASWLESAEVPYAVLKGFSLMPDSVPDPVLRSQTDLDFLIPRRSVSAVRDYITGRGYVLHAAIGRTLEFRKGAMGNPHFTRMYSADTQRALDLLVDEDDSERLARRCNRQIHGARIATLCSPDILVGQAAHLLKHLCAEYTRLNWVLEFARHVEARRGDSDFWRDVERMAASLRNGDVAMAVSLRLARDAFGLSAEGLPLQWSPERIPDRVRLWIDRYGMKLLLSDPRGSKLYALLRNEFRVAPGGARSTARVWFPNCLPKPITKAVQSEKPAQKMRRYIVEVRHFLKRLRFHGMAGAHLAFETPRWKWAVARCDVSAQNQVTRIPAARREC